MAAYLATSYTVEDAGRTVAVRIGQRSAEIDAVLRRHGATSGTFITAWNPGSVRQPESLNRAAGRALEHDLEVAGIAWLPHRGIGTDEGWAPEYGVLALDLPTAQALALATAHGQNAIVTVGRGEPARLVMTGLMPGPEPGPG